MIQKSIFLIKYFKYLFLLIFYFYILNLVPELGLGLG